jgi:hypothetical protein
MFGLDRHRHGEQRSRRLAARARRAVEFLGARARRVALDTEKGVQLRIEPVERPASASSSVARTLRSSRARARPVRSAVASSSA